MIVENVPLLNRFISIPKEYGDLNCSAFVAGIIEEHLIIVDSMPMLQHTRSLQMQIH